MTPERRRALSAALVLAAVACLAASLARFAGPDAAHASGWRLYWAALALAAAGAWPWAGRPSEAPPITRREVALLGLALAAGLAFRSYRLPAAPAGVWFDEAQNGLEAVRILAEPDYRPVFVPGVSQLPGLVFQYFAVLVDRLGPNVFALRVGSTLVGLLAIVAVWGLGRELFGPRVAVLSAAFLALSRWHVTFSRFAVANIAVTLFLPLALLLFVRALRRRSPRLAVLCGLALGLGLQSYYAMLAGPIAVTVLFVLEWIRAAARRAAAAGVLALALGAGAFAYAPVIQYARAHPEEYGRRLSATTFVPAGSLGGALAQLVRPGPPRAAAWAAIGANLRAHALMFHVRGDGNGRHNLPGAPMLDPVSGLFFAIGLAWLLARAWNPSRAAVLLPFAAMMAAGVLSLTFEAPQGARTLGATPFVAIAAACGLDLVARRVEPRGGPRSSRLVTAGMLAAAGAWSFVVFDRQLWDASVWESWSAPETHVAEVVRAHGRNADVYVTDTLAGGPTFTFILGRPLEAIVYDRSLHLPLPDRGRDALVFLVGSDVEGVPALRAMYPAASLEPYGAPERAGGMGRALLWIARVPAAAIASLQGWTVTRERDGREPGATVAGASAWEWTGDPPFTARVEGTLRATDDTERAFVLTGALGTLSVDGEEVLDGRTESAPLALARGLHAIVLRVPVRGRGQRTALAWRAVGERPVLLPSEQMLAPDVFEGGLLGTYHAGPRLEGVPRLSRVDREIAFYFHVVPVPRPFSARWSGSLYAATAGSYAFGTSAIDAATVLVDGQEILANEDASTYRESSVDLDRGWHAIEVRYRAESGYSQVLLQWVPPGGERGVLPAAVLRPPGPTGRLLARNASPPGRAPSRSGTIAASEASAPAPPSRAMPALAIAGSRETSFGEGVRLAVGAAGRAFVLDRGARALRPLAVRTSSTLPPPAGGWVEPSDVAVAPDGTAYVLDASGFVAAYEPSARGPRILDLRPLGVYNPRGLAAGPDEILVADTGMGRVLVLDRDARLRATVGRPGTGAGELTDPADVARDGAGALVIVDAGNGRIQRLARDGRAESWPRAGARSASLAEGVDVDGDGSVWVGGGAMPDLWRLAPGRAPERVPLPEPLTVEALAVARGRAWLAAVRPGRLVELAIR